MIDQKRIQIILMLAIISIGMGQFIVFAVLAPLIRSVGLQEYHGGLIISFSSLVFAFSSSVWGRISSLHGRRRVMMIGLIGYAAGTFLFTFGFASGLAGWLQGTTLFLFLAAARMLQSTLMGATNPAATAYMADITTLDQRVKGMGKIGSAHSIGTILGPAVAAPLLMLHLLAPFVAASVITGLTAWIVWRYLPEVVQEPRRIRLDLLSEVRHTWNAYFDLRYRSILVVGVLMFLGYAMCQQTIGYLVQDRLQLTAESTARVVAHAFMFSAVFSLLSQTLIVQRLRLDAMLLLFIGLPVMLLGYLLLAFMHSEAMALLAFSMIGFGFGMTMPGFMAASSMAVNAEEQGAIAGVMAGAPALGFIIGPTLGTVLYQVHSAIPNLLAAALYVVLALGVMRMQKARRAGHE